MLSISSLGIYVQGGPPRCRTVIIFAVFILGKLDKHQRLLLPQFQDTLAKSLPFRFLKKLNAPCPSP
ncbi:MAG TPA: hypothetical protein DCQ14_00910 [Firmicutes bacterium]|nr:hypothetical protein [Bacillota bacterium]